MNLDSISTRQLIFAYITGLATTMVLCFGIGFFAGELGVHWIFAVLLGFYLGLKVPTRIAAWILQAELTAIRSQLNGKRDE